MKHPLFFIPFLLLSIQSGAQDSSFQLRDYKFRTPGFKALQLNINGNGNLYDSKRINDVDVKGSSINSNFGISYFKIISSNRRQHLSTLSLTPVLNYSENVNGSSEQRSRNFVLDGNWNRVDRFFNQKNFFFEIGNELQIGGKREKQKSAFYNYRTNNNSISDMLILGVGKGRLENVQDAQMATFIVNDLRRMGLLKREPEAETLYELAVLITDINNRRVFDSRIRRIYELTRVDSFFQAKQLIAAPSISYFTTVNDNWALAFNPGRLSGTRFYAQLKPGIGFNVSGLNRSDTIQPLYKSDTKETTYFYEPEIGIEYQKPVSLQWQRTAAVSLRFRQTFTRGITKSEISSVTSEYEMFETYPTLALHSFYGVGYYPNNRTIVNAGLSIDGVYGVRNMGLGRPSYFSVSPGLRLHADYFINYRTRAFIDAGINYSYTELKDSRPVTLVYDKSVVNGNFNIGFSHIIF